MFWGTRPLGAICLLLSAAGWPMPARAGYELSFDLVDVTGSHEVDDEGNPYQRIPATDGSGMFYVVTVQVVLSPPTLERRRDPRAASPERPFVQLGIPHGGLTVWPTDKRAFDRPGATDARRGRSGDLFPEEKGATPSGLRTARSAYRVPARSTGVAVAEPSASRVAGEQGLRRSMPAPDACFVALDVTFDTTMEVVARQAQGAATAWSDASSGLALTGGPLVLGQGFGSGETWTHQIAFLVPGGAVGTLQVAISAQAWPIGGLQQ